jgi:magnesium-transporting ATPase (P-type)
VVIFRCSPQDKAETIKFVMQNPNNKELQFSLAVGDGANDVNMI